MTKKIFFTLYCLARSSALFGLPYLRSVRNYIYSKHFGAESLRVADFVLVSNAHVGGNPFIEIGKKVDLGRFVNIDYSGGIRIGQGVAISEGAKIYTHNHTVNAGDVDWNNNPIVFSNLKIGDYAWIGSNVIVLEGAKVIGKGAIIGAGAVVVSDIPDFAVAAGVPARIITYRNIET